MSPDFWHRFVNAVTARATVRPIPLRDTVNGETLKRLEGALSARALSSPVHITDWMPDRTFAAPVPDSSSPSGYRILLNGRYLVHPEYLEHVLAEEAMHVERYLKGRPMDMTLPYEQRLHEITAKAGADYAVGHTLPDYPVYMVREHPDGIFANKRQAIYRQGSMYGSSGAQRPIQTAPNKAARSPKNAPPVPTLKPTHYFMNAGSPVPVQIISGNRQVVQIVRKDGKANTIPRAFLKPIFPQ